MFHSNYNTIKAHPALWYLGGKALLSRRILGFFQDHHTYVEPFAGGLNVLLNKYRSPREIASDLNAEIIDFYRYLVDHPDSLIERVLQTPYCKEVFLKAVQSPSVDDLLERSLNTLIKYRMSRSGDGKCFFDSSRYTGEAIKKWKSVPGFLQSSADRLRGVEFRCQNAFDVISEFDSPDTCFYCDPSYYFPGQGLKRQYEFELSSFDHLRFLNLLKSRKGQVILSGYPTPLYDQELKDWERYEFNLKCQSSQSSGSWSKSGDIQMRVTEVIWVKPHQVF